jgi:hypothetical protein
MQSSLIGTRNHLDAEDRIAAQFKEIVVDAHLLHAQHLLPDVDQ